MLPRFRRLPSARGWPLLLASAVALLSAVPSALASPNYPPILDRHTGVECPRPLTRCLICHVTAAGGDGTAEQPFAIVLVDEFELEGKDGRGLALALDELPADRDTDGDGSSDQEELAACRNPSGEELSTGPGYGCGVAPALRSPATSQRGADRVGSALWLAFGSLLLAVGLVRRWPSSTARAHAPR